MKLADLQRAAAAAIADYKALGERIDQFFASDPTFTPARRAALLGAFPSWAHYVLSLGEPAAVGTPTRAQLEVSLGSAKNMRAFALRILAVADQVDPVELPGVTS